MRALAIIVAGLLRELAERVESRDSFEGSVSWTCMLDELGRDEYDLSASYRTGNRNGQGGMVIIPSIIKNVTPGGWVLPEIQECDAELMGEDTR